MLFISGQILEAAEDEVPDSFEVQARLASPDHNAANSCGRCEVLGAHAPALIVIITGICDMGWLREIEAIAATPAHGTAE